MKPTPLPGMTLEALAAQQQQQHQANAAAAFAGVFVLADADGDDHSYQVQAHRPTEGQRIMFQLLAQVAPPGTALGGLLAKGVGNGGLKLDDLDVELMDFTKLGHELQRVLSAEITPQLATDILAHTYRDGHLLGEQAQFDRAYSRNYGELLTAVWRVIRVNRFFPLPATWLDAIETGGDLLTEVLQSLKSGEKPSDPESIPGSTESLSPSPTEPPPM
jgi:hypothetical protein